MYVCLNQKGRIMKHYASSPNFNVQINLRNSIHSSNTQAWLHAEQYCSRAVRHARAHTRTHAHTHTLTKTYTKIYILIHAHTHTPSLSLLSILQRPTAQNFFSRKNDKGKCDRTRAELDRQLLQHPTKLINHPLHLSLPIHTSKVTS